jgi:hypothetical protein
MSDRYYVKFTTADGQLVYTLTGWEVIVEKGSGSEWRRFPKTFEVPVPALPSGQLLKLIHWAPFVTLNSIANDQAAVDAGWAVDDFGIANANEPLKTLRVECMLAVRDIDGLILRLGYVIQLLGNLVPDTPPK